MVDDLISLYFHIPFCTKKCDYCHFYVLPDKEALKLQLMEGFKLELALRKEQLANKRLASIYFGGGTPALWGAQRLKELLEVVHSYIPFDPNTIEITLEANPENITQELMQGYKEAGVNRVSIGIQTLDDPLLIKLGRTHMSGRAEQAVFETTNAGIENISIDLMYDIPSQTLASWEKTLDRIRNWPISHLSLYNLTIEPHTVFFKYQETLLKQVPDAAASAEMYQMAIERLSAYGLKQYEISAFAKNDRHSRHNTGYWTARPFLGFGPSAFSYWEKERFRNVANLSRYLKALQEGKPPVDFSETLDPEPRLRELLAIALRLCQGVDTQQFQNMHGQFSQSLLASLRTLEAEGFLLSQQNHLYLTQKGILFYDTVAVELI